MVTCQVATIGLVLQTYPQKVCEKVAAAIHKW